MRVGIYHSSSLCIVLVLIVMGTNAVPGEPSDSTERKALLVRAEKQFDALLSCIEHYEDTSESDKIGNQMRRNSPLDCLLKMFVLDFRRLVQVAYDVEEDNAKLTNRTQNLEAQLELMKSQEILLQHEMVEMQENLTMAEIGSQVFENETVELRKELSTMNSQASLRQAEIVELRDELGKFAEVRKHADEHMFRAMDEQNMATLQLSVAIGANVNAVGGEKGYPPLLIAWERSNTNSEFARNATTFLINQGANATATNEDGHTFLYHLVEKIHSTYFPDLASFLISKNLSTMFNIRDSTGTTQFSRAVNHIEMKTETLSLLHKNGVDFNAVGNHGFSVLAYAVYGPRSLEMISDLVRFGANPRYRNAKGKTLLHVAALSFAGADVVKYFIDLGLDVNALDEDGRSPLWDAVVHYHSSVLEKVRVLINNGADTKMKYNGVTIGQRVMESDSRDDSRYDSYEDLYDRAIKLIRTSE